LVILFQTGWRLALTVRPAAVHRQTIRYRSSTQIMYGLLSG
jgi:hypothetical protein